MRRRHGDEGELGEARLRGASHVGGRARGRVGSEEIFDGGLLGCQVPVRRRDRRRSRGRPRATTGRVWAGCREVGRTESGDAPHSWAMKQLFELGVCIYGELRVRANANLDSECEGGRQRPLRRRRRRKWRRDGRGSGDEGRRWRWCGHRALARRRRGRQRGGEGGRGLRGRRRRLRRCGWLGGCGGDGSGRDGRGGGDEECGVVWLRRWRCGQ